jgi:hypothetical protein
MKDYDQFSELFSSIHKFIAAKKATNKYFNLAIIVGAVFSNSKKIKNELENFFDINRPATKIIDEMVERVRIAFKLDPNNQDKIESIITIYPDGEEKVIPERDLVEAKEKSIILLASSGTEEEKERVKKIPLFLDICKNY